MIPLSPRTGNSRAEGSRSRRAVRGYANNVVAEEKLPSWLTVAKFVDHCGLSTSTVRRLIKSGSLPYAQPGGPGTRVLIPADALSHARGDVGVPQEPAASTAPTAVIEPALPEKRAGPKPRWKQGYETNNTQDKDTDAKTKNQR